MSKVFKLEIEKDNNSNTKFVCPKKIARIYVNNKDDVELATIRVECHVGKIYIEVITVNQNEDNSRFLASFDLDEDYY